MPKILKKDIINHIENFFSQNGKRLTNLSKCNLTQLKKIMKDYEIPEINSDDIFKQKEIEKEERKKEEEQREKDFILSEYKRQQYLCIKQIWDTKHIKKLYNNPNKIELWKDYIEKCENKERTIRKNNYSMAKKLCDDANIPYSKIKVKGHITYLEGAIANVICETGMCERKINEPCFY